MTIAPTDATIVDDMLLVSYASLAISYEALIQNDSVEIEETTVINTVHDRTNSLKQRTKTKVTGTSMPTQNYDYSSNHTNLRQHPSGNECD
jgi:hypothetical protein